MLLERPSVSEKNLQSMRAMGNGSGSPAQARLTRQDQAVMKDLLKTSDLSRTDLTYLLESSRQFKAEPLRQARKLAAETVCLYFAKPSTRTRISFETAVTRLGGVPVTLGASDL